LGWVPKKRVGLLEVKRTGEIFPRGKKRGRRLLRRGAKTPLHKWARKLIKIQKLKSDASLCMTREYPKARSEEVRKKW